MGSLLHNHSRRKHVLKTTTQWMVRGVNSGISNQGINKIWVCLIPGIVNKSISVISCSTPVLHLPITHSCPSQIPDHPKFLSCPVSLQRPSRCCWSPREEPDPALPLQNFCESFRAQPTAAGAHGQTGTAKTGYQGNQKIQKMSYCLMGIFN